MEYQGSAEGECRFSTGAGDILLRLPEDIDVEVHLSVGVGSISVGFPVDGTVGAHAVDGMIGSGTAGRIVAESAVGRITLVPY